MSKTLKIFVLSLFSGCFLFLSTAEAVPLYIIDSPQHAGGFTHNVFHTSTNGGGSGFILAWFDLDDSKTSTYDPTTGDIKAYFEIYGNAGLTQSWGSVSAIGLLPASAFHTPDTNSLAGVINYTFDFTNINALSSYLAGDNSVDISYLDKVYTTTQGRDVNGWEEPYLSLWGSGHVDGQQYYLGTDLVIKTGEAVVPEPMTLLLMGSGIIGAFGLHRRSEV